MSHDEGRATVPDEVIVRDFADFHSLTYRFAYRAARRVAGGNDEIVYDAVQDAYAAMLSAWEERCERPLGENRPYLLRIVFNKVMDHYRLSGRLVELQEDHDSCVDDPALDAVLDDLTLRREVGRLLDAQPSRRRAVAILRFLAGLEYSEIAATLGVTESTVRTQVERVRVLLKSHVEQMRRIDGEGERS